MDGMRSQDRGALCTTMHRAVKVGVEIGGEKVLNFDYVIECDPCFADLLPVLSLTQQRLCTEGEC